MGFFSCLLASLTLWIFLALYFLFLSGSCVYFESICLRWKWQCFCHDLTLLETMFFVLCLFSWGMRQFSVFINAGCSLANKQTKTPKTLKQQQQKTTPQNSEYRLSILENVFFKKLSRQWELNMGENFFERSLFCSNSSDLLVLWKWNLVCFLL